jgi:CheY-like chemotaxis protein
MKHVLADRRIVLVEDDYNLRYILRTYFQGKAQLTAYDTAESCVNALSDIKNPDVFVIDYLLPKMNGIELFKLIKPHFPKAKMILMTGNLSSEVAEEGLHIGFDRLILKPFDFVSLEKNIHELIGNSKS